MWTVLDEDFTGNGLNRDIWEVSGVIKDHNLFKFVDSSATVNVNQAYNQLELTMIKPSGGYNVVIDGETINVPIITGEISTIEDFSYGIFECSATFAYNKGSFPAFWLYNNSICDYSKRNEVDIVECKKDRSTTPTFDVGVWYYPPNCGNSTHHAFNEMSGSWSGFHTYKCEYTPSQIKVYRDNVLKYTLTENNQYWYPDQKMHVILSQQATRFGWIDPSIDDIVAPQTSKFHWVKVKQFFLAPEITIPQMVCSGSPEIATLDVDQQASNISWTLSPSNWFSTNSGYGKTANINSIYNGIGTGTATITYTFQMPSEETFTKSVNFWVSDEYDFDVYCEGGDGGPVGSYPLWVTPYFSGDNIEWGVYPYAEITDMGNGYASIYFDSPGNYTISANSDHGCADNPAYAYFYVYNYFLSPNPANDDVEVTIDYGESENLKMKEQEYLVTITDVNGLVKSKKKYNGNKFHVSTNMLKDGNYFVNLKSNKISATKQLVIKR